MICKGLFSGKITHVQYLMLFQYFMITATTARIYHLYLPHDLWYNTFPQKCRLTKFCRMICKRFRLLNPVADILFLIHHIFSTKRTGSACKGKIIRYIHRVVLSIALSAEISFFLIKIHNFIFNAAESHENPDKRNQNTIKSYHHFM